ncbi:putative 3-hydroxyisobutyrate dehydrogenase [Candidatus Zixiibacteriota bacterium]|nr:putative 3-hydroxyisobutyrate dehydrogenase [candidate division Zixibacteria bacterium]
MKIGFIGLGNLGRAMAQHLISEGLKLTVWNRTIEKTAGLHAEIADSPAALISKVDMVILNLSESTAVREVLTGERGLLQGEVKGKIILDTTTNHFNDVIEFRDLAARIGLSYLEAPVMGSVVPASQGNLTILVSGDEGVYRTSLPVLQMIGKTIHFLKTPGLATKMKLINNLCLGSFMATIAEAVAFGEAAGMEKEKILEILSGGAGNSTVLNGKRDKLLHEDFTPHFSSAMIYKDLHYLQDLARVMNRPLWTAGIPKELFGLAIARGERDSDFSAVYRILK